MFNTANCRRLVAAMPRNRVVPESDGPFAQINGEPLMPWCEEQTVTHLSKVWNAPDLAVASLLVQNSKRLLSLIRETESHRIP